MLPSSVSSMDINSYQQSSHRVRMGDVPSTNSAIPRSSLQALNACPRSPTKRQASFSPEKKRYGKENAKVFLTQPDSKTISKLSDSITDYNVSTDTMSPVKPDAVLEHKFESWNIEQVSLYSILYLQFETQADCKSYSFLGV